MLSENRPNRVIRAGREFSRNRGLFRIFPDEALLGLAAKRHVERIKNDRFTRPGLTRQRCETIAHVEVKFASQNEITNRERGNHSPLIA